ncbi:MAG: universal stress protein [Chloroflexota bacterium]|nr:universal stress protein [Chloroflexota bacterium]
MKIVERQMYKHIMVPLDGSELAECVLPHLNAVAGGCEIGKVTLVRVVEPFHLLRGYESRIEPEEQKHLDDDAKKVARDYLEQVAKRLKLDGMKVQTEVLYGKTADALIDYARKNDVDLVIISTHGRSGVSRWVWGSVADRILRHICAPVFMVRAPGCFPSV